MKRVCLGVLGALVSTSAQQPPLEALPSILRLQLDQRPAWRAYKDDMAETRAEGSHDMATTARLNGLSTPGRLAAIRAQMKVQQADFERQAIATETFYSVLSPDQKRIFDQVTRLPTPLAPMHAYPAPAASGAWRSETIAQPPQPTLLPNPVR